MMRKCQVKRNFTGITQASREVPIGLLIISISGANANFFGGGVRL